LNSKKVSLGIIILNLFVLLLIFIVIKKAVF